LDGQGKWTYGLNHRPVPGQVLDARSFIQGLRFV